MRAADQSLLARRVHGQRFGRKDRPFDHDALAPRAARRMVGLGVGFVFIFRAAAAQRAPDTTGGRGPTAGVQGVLIGRVTDGENGAPLAGATILVAGTLLRAETGASGVYRIAGVSAGAYDVHALRIGFRGVTIRGVALAPSETRTLDLALPRATVQLSSVVVTASRGETRAGDVPASISSLPRQEILGRVAYRLDQALLYVPGVVFNDGDIDIRGSTGVSEGIGSRVLVLLDGHPVLSADGAETDLKAVPVLDIDRVEVVKGPYSALYGGNALGGVVNVITAPISEQPQTLIDMHYGTFDPPSQYRYTSERLSDAGFELQHSRRLGDVGARFVIGREASTGFRQDDPQDQWLFRTKLVYPAHAAHPSSLYAIWSNERLGNFFRWADPSTPYVNSPGHERDYQWYDKISLGGSAVGLATQSWLLQVQPYLDYNNARAHYFQDSLTAFASLRPVTHADSLMDRVLARSDTLNLAFHRATKYGANVQASFTPSGRQSIVFGGEESATSVQADALASVPELHDWGVYAQDELALSRPWSVTVGGRIDSHTSTGRAETTLNPKFGVVYHASSPLSFRTSVTRGYRAPSAIEQFVNQYQQGVHVVPNDTLRGETAWSEEVGATEDLGNLWFDAAAFETDYHNLIQAEPADFTFTNFSFQNVTNARIRGLDAGMRLGVIPDRVGLALTYLYLTTRNLSHAANNALYGTALPYRSKHNVTGSLDLFRGLVGVDMRYRSRVERVELYETDPRAPVTLFDLRFAYRVRGVVLQAKASNIFQAHYVDVLERIPGAPRTFLLSALKPF